MEKKSREKNELDIFKLQEGVQVQRAGDIIKNIPKTGDAF